MCHGDSSSGGPNFRKHSTINYVTSITGSSHQWTSDGASSVYAPTANSFRIYMFREGDDAGVATCAPGQISTPQNPCNIAGCGQPFAQPCAHAQTGTGSGGGHALTAAGAEADHWKINWIGVQN